LDFLTHDVSHAPFWIAVVQIVGVNVVLSGDNAVVIALACMTLPRRQRLWGMILGAGVAVLLRVAFTIAVVQAMSYPYLRLIGGLLLFWVAVKLVVEDEGAGNDVKPGQTLWRAVGIVAIADVVMSLDNVIAIAAAAETAAAGVDPAHGAAMKMALIVFGLATSIPLIVAGSALLMALLERYKILVWAGGALLGWIAGDIMSTDPALMAWIGGLSPLWHPWAGRIGAAIVVGLGLLLVSRNRRLTREDVLAGIGLIVLLVAAAVIDRIAGAEAAAGRWLALGAVAAALAAAYLALRGHRPSGREEL
jgi:YjbE family integral membrane protein